jgi:hypothetical protein
MLLGCFRKEAFSKKIKQYTDLWSLKKLSWFRAKKVVAMKAWTMDKVDGNPSGVKQSYSSWLFQLSVDFLT